MALEGRRGRISTATKVRVGGKPQRASALLSSRSGPRSCWKKISLAILQQGFKLRGENGIEEPSKKKKKTLLPLSRLEITVAHSGGRWGERTGSRHDCHLDKMVQGSLSPGLSPHPAMDLLALHPAFPTSLCFLLCKMG